MSVSAAADSDGLTASAVLLLKSERAARDIELRTRKRKKIRCSCGYVASTKEDFQVHAETAVHDDDWGYDCEDIEVEEMVTDKNDD